MRSMIYYAPSDWKYTSIFLKEREMSMRIKLAILEGDTSYLNRIVAVFNTKYSDKLEIYSFTDEEVALATLNTAKIDVLLVSDFYEIDVTHLPKRCGFAYLVDSPDIDSVKGQMAICKFQKADLIYKQILSVYSEVVSNVSGLKLNVDGCKVVVFTSASGGTGSSTMAASCAVNYAGKDRKVLYLNLENFGSSDVFFESDGQFDMSDIVYALKSKKTNLALKLESCVKRDISGVYFFSQPKVALDILELSTDEILQLISELEMTGAFDYIVVDMEFGLDEKYLKIYEKAHAIVLVGDGSELSNLKTIRAFQALTTLEQSMDASISNRMSLIYNKFSNKTGKVIESIGLKNIGGAPRYEHASVKQVVNQLAGMEMFEQIM